MSNDDSHTVDVADKLTGTQREMDIHDSDNIHHCLETQHPACSIHELVARRHCMT